MTALGPVFTGDGLVAYQRQLARQVSFSLTAACPLKCSHCMVNVLPVRARQDVTMTVAQAHRYAAEMDDLAAAGVERVSFTGGEPLLAAEPLSILSAAAQAAGMSCSVVTACHWARSADAARRTVARFPGLRTWHLSTDRFHAEHLSPEFVVRAARAALDDGARVVVRVAVSAGDATKRARDDDAAGLAWLEHNLPPGAEVAVQRVMDYGGAARPSADGDDAHWVPCMTTCMLIRHDGSVGPCCSALADQRDGHPFLYESAQEAGLVASYQAWCDDPLLQLVRSVGFGPVFAWAREAAPAASNDEAVPDHPCEQCVALWRSPGVADHVSRRVRTEGVRAKITALAATVFAEDAGADAGSRASDAAASS